MNTLIPTIHTAPQTQAGALWGGVSFGQALAEGTVKGYSALQTSGENPSIDAGAYVTILDGGGTYVAPTVGQMHNVKSTDAQDGATIEATGTVDTATFNTLTDLGADFVAAGILVNDVVLVDGDLLAASVVNVTATTLTVAAFFELDAGLVLTPTSGSTYRVIRAVGTGASWVLLQGQDAAHNEIKEYVVLNGITNVPTVAEYYRLYKARTFGAIGILKLTGVLTATASIDATVSLQVTDGNNQSLMALTTNPVGKVGYIQRWWGSLARKKSATAGIRLRVGNFNGFSYVRQSRSLQGQGTSAFDHQFSVPVKLGPTFDVWVEADVSENATAISAGFDILYKDI